MIAEGAQPGKAWIYGRLVAQTRNNPRCSVAWGWHVAPTLPVGDPAVIFVIDPALFERPQPLDAWKQAVNGATATLAETDAPVYRTSAGVSTTDPNYILTENVLGPTAQQLKLRSAGADGPPPLDNAPRVSAWPMPSRSAVRTTACSSSPMGSVLG